MLLIDLVYSPSAVFGVDCSYSYNYSTKSINGKSVFQIATCIANVHPLVCDGGSGGGNSYCL